MHGSSSLTVAFVFISCVCVNSISDDDEGPPMSTKFGDVYAMSAYEDHSAVTGSVNGLHTDLNGGGGESAELKVRVRARVVNVQTLCPQPISNPAFFVIHRTKCKPMHFE